MKTHREKFQLFKRAKYSPTHRKAGNMNWLKHKTIGSQGDFEKEQTISPH